MCPRVVAMKIVSLSIASALVLASVGSAASAQTPAEPVRYGRIHADAVAFRNLADEQGLVVSRVAKGTPVKIHSEDSAIGWMQAEIPGGFPAWVHGKFLAPSTEAGVFEVTGNAVNLRPEQGQDISNFPLPERLQSGDRVRAIELPDPQKPLAETWVHVWTPQGAPAWVRSSAVAPLAAGEDGALVWKAALEPFALRLASKTAPLIEASAPSKASAPASSAAPEAKAPAPRADAAKAEEQAQRAKLAELHASIEAEAQEETSDFAPLRAELEALSRSTPSGPLAVDTRRELEYLRNQEELAALRLDLLAEKGRRIGEVRAKQDYAVEAGRAKDPLGDVFAARGALERRAGADGTARYYLRFAGRDVCEVASTNRRYDLEVFAGFEIGVNGAEIPATGTSAGALPLLDVSRLEVLARR